MRDREFRTDSLYFYCLALAATHLLAITIFYRENLAGESLNSSLGLWLLVIAPVAFGFSVRTWRQFFIFLLVTLIVWQLTPWVMDWLMDRLNNPDWWEDRADTWPREILLRGLYPLALASGGALLGRFRSAPRFR